MHGTDTEVYSRISSGVSVFFPTGCKRLYKRHPSIPLSLMFVHNIKIMGDCVLDLDLYLIWKNSLVERGSRIFLI